MGLEPFCCGGKLRASRSTARWLSVPGKGLVIGGLGAEGVHAAAAGDDGHHPHQDDHERMPGLGDPQPVEQLRHAFLGEPACGRLWCGG